MCEVLGSIQQREKAGEGRGSREEASTWDGGPGRRGLGRGFTAPVWSDGRGQDGLVTL